VVRPGATSADRVLSDECYVYLNYTGKNFSVRIACAKYKEAHCLCWVRISKTYCDDGLATGLGAAVGSTVVSAMSKLQSQSTSNPHRLVQKAAVKAAAERKAQLSW